MPEVTIAIPLHTGGDTLARAVSCAAGPVAGGLDAEILIVLNGADAASRAAAGALAGTDARVRLITLERASLAHAMNVALREASCELVARMDADDECDPQRIPRQLAHMRDHPALAAVGCAYAMVEAGTGRPIATIRPSADPAALRWTLLLRNDLAHGSMMLRRSAILDAGGYDEARERAQDYELWLRLSGFSERSRPGAGAVIAALPEVLYTYHVRHGAAYSSSALQARHAAGAMLDAWRTLPQDAPADLPELLAGALGDEGGSATALEGIQDLLANEPTLPTLAAWLWVRSMLPPMERRAMQVSKRARLREVGIALRGHSVRELLLWGAGAHSAFVLEHAHDLGVRVVGLVDDALAGQSRLGFEVASPDLLKAGQHVLLSSDAHEDALWERSAPARARGVVVHRLYSDDPDQPARW